MNRKKARQLRRQAEAMSIGLPYYRLIKHSVVNQHTAINDQQSTRGIYRTLKGAAR